MLELNKIYNGDCLELMKDIDDKSIDMILCDLPYGTTACSWDVIIPFEPLWEQYNRIIKDNGAIVLTGSEPFSSYLRVSNIKNYKYDWIWNKGKAGNSFIGKYQPIRITENILIFSKYKTIYNYNLQYKNRNRNKDILVQDYEKLKNGKCFPISIINKNLKNNKQSNYYYPNNVININCQSNECNNTIRLHPTQKPVALFEYLIKTYTNENDIVLDNCIGSGTTAIACLNTNRKYIGFELDREYFDIAEKRIKEHKRVIRRQVL